MSVLSAYAYDIDDKKDIPADSIKITKVLEPVTVYSQRTAEDLRSVPASVSAFTPARIERENIVSIKEATSRIPNFYMPDYGNKVNSPVYIRGIGSKFTTPSVAYYVDNVPYFEKSTFDFDLFDIKSLEVLRGPQGTLFGRNSMGGVVSIFSKEPSAEMRNRLSASYGEKNYMRFTGSHLNTYGKVGISVGASYVKRDGFFTNSFNGKKVDNIEDFNSRIMLTYKVTPTFNVKLIGSVGFNNDGGNPYGVFDTSTKSFKEVSYNEETYYTRNMVSGAVVLSKKFGEYELRNVTSYQYFQDHQHMDNDYTAEDLYVNDFYQYQNLVTNELVFITPKVWKWSSQTGIFFFNQKFDRGFDIKNGADVVKYQAAPYPYTQNIPGVHVTTRTGEKSNGIAFFHQSQLKDVFTSGLDLSLGARLDYEDKDFGYDNSVSVPGMPRPIVATPVDTVKKKLVFLPKATLTYDIEGQKVYLSWGVGYKSGGFNTSYDKSNPGTIAYNPEYAENFEVGFKTQWFENKLNVNASVFYTDWKNQQINQFLPNGQGLMITNAGHSYSKGFEVEANAVPFQNFQIYASYGYVKAKFLDYRMNATTVYDGNYVPLVPQSTFSAGGCYRIPFGDSGNSSLAIGMDVQRIGKLYWNDANKFALFPGAKAYEDAWYTLNGSIGYSYKNIDVSVSGKNLTNNKYNAYVFEYEVEKFQNLYAQKGRPRMLFVELSYRF